MLTVAVSSRSIYLWKGFTKGLMLWDTSANCLTVTGTIRFFPFTFMLTSCCCFNSSIVCSFWWALAASI